MKRFTKRDVVGELISHCATTASWFGLAARASLILWVLNFPPSSSAQQGKPTAYEVEATYLYQFSNFVQWPTADRAADQPVPFTICVLGRDPFDASLEKTVKGENVAGAAVTTKRIAASSEAGDCRILFIATSEQNRLPKTLMALAKLPILTVSDIPNFADNGGMIGFVLKDNRVRFEVNSANAQTAGLTLSSQLLKVAVTVKGQPDSQK
jgi:hypothetical protein